MLRKIIDTQEDQAIVLDLPKELQGRRIEIIAFPIDTKEEDVKAIPAVMGDFIGTISAEQGDRLLQHMKNAREEWDRNF